MGAVSNRGRKAEKLWELGCREGYRLQEGRIQLGRGRWGEGWRAGYEWEEGQMGGRGDPVGVDHHEQRIGSKKR